MTPSPERERARVGNYLDVCAGISAPTVAWSPLGWKAWAYSEIERFPSAVLAHHYPTVPNLGDMTRFKEWPDANVDLLVGGTPCQSFSVAGLRKGLADPRGNLMLTYGAIAAKYRPRWLVWENVPGVLSSNGGRDFGTFLGMLGQLGYGYAYRVLDAQYAGVPQRRRRVFVVGCLGDWRRAAAVLFERHSLSGDSAPRREAGKTAPTIPSRSTAGGGLGTDFDCDGGLIPTLARCDTTGEGARQDYETCTLVAHSLRGEGFDASEDGTGRGIPLVAHAFDARQSDVIQYGDMTGPLDTDGHTIAVAFSCKDHGADAGETAPTLRAMGHAGSHENAGGQVAIAFNMHKSGNEGSSLGISRDRTDCLRAFEKSPFAVMAPASAVRRLTPRECARLQGFPDHYLDIPYRGKPAADGPKYKALGNSMAVPVIRWIGARIAAVEAIQCEQQVAA